MNVVVNRFSRLAEISPKPIPCVEPLNLCPSSDPISPIRGNNFSSVGGRSNFRVHGQESESVRVGQTFETQKPNLSMKSKRHNASPFWPFPAAQAACLWLLPIPEPPKSYLIVVGRTFENQTHPSQPQIPAPPPPPIHQSINPVPSPQSRTGY